MRGESLHLQPIIASGDLRRVLEAQLCQYFARRVSIVKLERRISDYCSSYLIEELDVALDDGTTHALILKDLSHDALLEGAGRVKPQFVYDPLREIETYRRVLIQHQFGTATCFGAEVDPARGRHWLFLERVAPVLLWQMGDFAVWKEVARWLAGMHTFLVREAELRESAHLAHLLRYDPAFYRCWMDRAARFVTAGDHTAGRKSAAAIQWIAARYDRAIERLAALPVTVIHGEFFASNVMIDPAPDHPRICPVDWEMAGTGPGLVDLAALTSGGWTPAQKLEMATAYYEALPAATTDRLAPADFHTQLELCRLHQAVQLLGWSPHWSPPPEHAQDWLQEAVRCAETLGL